MDNLKLIEEIKQISKNNDVEKKNLQKITYPRELDHLDIGSIQAFGYHDDEALFNLVEFCATYENNFRMIELMSNVRAVTTELDSIRLLMKEAEEGAIILSLYDKKNYRKREGELVLLFKKIKPYLKFYVLPILRKTGIMEKKISLYTFKKLGFLYGGEEFGEGSEEQT